MAKDSPVRLAAQQTPRANLVTAQRKKTSVPRGACDRDEGRIHCAAADEPDDGADDLQQIEIGNFIDTLAEIALGVARRRRS